MTDEELALRLTQALDARIIRAEAAVKSLPPREKDRAAHAGAEEEASRARTTEQRAQTLRATKVRWHAVLAAVLALCVLIGIGLLLINGKGWETLTQILHPDPDQPPEPENCSYEEFPDGVGAWVRNGTYSGLYDLQTLIVPTHNEPGLKWYEVAMPEGFLRQELLSYQDYAAYCAEFGLEQTYTDPSLRYLVVARAKGHWSVQGAEPVDVIVRDHKVWLWLWDQFAGCIDQTEGYVLTVPVPAETEEAELFSVLSAGEAVRERLYHSTQITEQADGKLRIEGWSPGAAAPPACMLFYCGNERIGLIFGEDLVVDDPDDPNIYLGVPGVKYLAEDCVEETLTREDAAVDRLFRAGKFTILDVSNADTSFGLQLP